MSKENEYLEIQKIVKKYEGKKGALIPVLQDVQEKLGYLSEEYMRKIAELMNIKVSEVLGVATFYTQFYFEPRGKKIIKVCRGTACHVKGGGTVLDEIKKILNIDEGETTSDGIFTLETVACLGACGLAPVLMINDRVHGRLTSEDIADILELHRNEVLSIKE